jgi:hypothetical protein
LIDSDFQLTRHLKKDVIGLTFPRSDGNRAEIQGLLFGGFLGFFLNKIPATAIKPIPNNIICEKSDIGYPRLLVLYIVIGRYGFLL